MAGPLRTTVLLAGLTALFAGVGFVLGGRGGMLVALLAAAATNLWAWWNSGAAVLRMHRARPLGPAEAPELFRLVQGLADRAELPMPALYLLDEAQPNAFATGRDPQHAAVAVTAGLLDHLSPEEVAGVVAHELAHIRNRDTLIMTVTACLAGAIGLLAQFGMFFGGSRDGRGNPVATVLAVLVAPFAAMLVQMAISRSREYEADRIGAAIAGSPRGLASALLRLEDARHALPNPTAEANPATAHLFITNPLSRGGLDNLFSTHPSTANRVQALLGPRATAAPPRPSSGPWSRNPPAPTRPGPWG